MPVTNKYVTEIIINDVSDYEQITPVAGSSGQAGTGNAVEPPSIYTQAAKKIKGLVSYGTVSSIAGNLVSYEISKVTLQTGASEHEQKLNAYYGIGRKIVNIGAAYAIGGPIAGTAALVGTVVNTAVSYVQRQNTLNLQQEVENMSISLQNRRAGTRGRRWGNTE